MVVFVVGRAVESVERLSWLSLDGLFEVVRKLGLAGPGWCGVLAGGQEGEVGGEGLVYFFGRARPFGVYRGQLKGVREGQTGPQESSLPAGQRHLENLHRGQTITI